MSAHIKLLLDAPEHLWRLIERKKYFQAGWLFLLARVVHRALVRDDDQDQENWANQGIDVTVSLVITHLYRGPLAELSCAGAISSRSTAVGCCFPFSHTDSTQGNPVAAIIYHAFRGMSETFHLVCRLLMHLGRILALRCSPSTYWILGRSQKRFLYFSLSGLKHFTLYSGNHPIHPGPWILISRIRAVYKLTGMLQNTKHNSHLPKDAFARSDNRLRSLLIPFRALSKPHVTYSKTHHRPAAR